jgi:hypothetical protein
MPQPLGRIELEDSNMPLITAKELTGLLIHVTKWLANLARARKVRRQQSIDALEKVILAVRETATYMRQLQETGKKSHKMERRLSLLWTELSFSLDRLGLNSLAHRCNIKGRFWSDPKKFDEEFLQQANIKLDDIERDASIMMDQIRKK